jgi:hypothetical protein
VRPHHVSALPLQCLRWGFLLAAAACGDAAGGTERLSPVPETPALTARRFVLVAIDRSASRSAKELLADRALMDKVVERLSYGDRVAVLDVCESGRKETCRPWTRTMAERHPGRPARTDSLMLVASRQDVSDFIGQLLKDSSAAKLRGTDLLASFHNVSDLVHEVHSSATLVVFSDMLQAAGGVNMTPPHVPDTAMIGDKLNPPSLNGLCVSVVGADPSTPHGQKVLSFWTAYFACAGARFSADRYRRFATRAEPLLCEA